MAFPRVKPAGWVGDIDPITAAQINQLDINVSQAVDSRGGPNVLTSPMSFTGQLVSFDFVEVFDLLTAANIEAGTAEFDDAVTFAEGFTVENGITVFDGGAVNILATSGPLTCSAPATFNGAVTMNDDVTLGSASDDVVTINGTVVFTSGQIITQVLQLFATGRIQFRVIEAADADLSIGVNSADEVVFQTLSATRTVTIIPTSAGPGARIRVVHSAAVGGYELRVQLQESIGSYWTLMSSGIGNLDMIEFTRNSTNTGWYVSATGHGPFHVDAPD